MIEKLEQFDQYLFLILNGLHADWLDPIMWYLSSIGLMIPVFLFVLFYVFKKEKGRYTIAFLIGLALCIFLSDRISVEFFKEVFQRYRPTHNTAIADLVHTVFKPNGEEYRGGLFSFVSSHATNSFSLAAFTFLHLNKHNKFWFFIFVWAAIVSYTRIYLGVHYPADLLGGGLLGLTIGTFIYWVSMQFKVIFVQSEKPSKP